ncbi:MAG: hypothetical protein LBJ16_02900 [Holosporaceae bacterium]|jgi:hypothetical protein|nr:hypothetical protein [Holosporaceae bacterium]
MKKNWRASSLCFFVLCFGIAEARVSVNDLLTTKFTEATKTMPASSWLIWGRLGKDTRYLDGLRRYGDIEWTNKPKSTDEGAPPPMRDFPRDKGKDDVMSLIIRLFPNFGTEINSRRGAGYAELASNQGKAGESRKILEKFATWLLFMETYRQTADMGTNLSNNRGSSAPARADDTILLISADKLRQVMKEQYDKSWNMLACAEEKNADGKNGTTAPQASEPSPVGKAKQAGKEANQAKKAAVDAVLYLVGDNLGKVTRDVIGQTKILDALRNANERTIGEVAEGFALALKKVAKNGKQPDAASAAEIICTALGVILPDFKSRAADPVGTWAFLTKLFLEIQKQIIESELKKCGSDDHDKWGTVAAFNVMSICDALKYLADVKKEENTVSGPQNNNNMKHAVAKHDEREEVSCLEISAALKAEGPSGYPKYTVENMITAYICDALFPGGDFGLAKFYECYGELRELCPLTGDALAEKQGFKDMLGKIAGNLGEYFGQRGTWVHYSDPRDNCSTSVIDAEGRYKDRVFQNCAEKAIYHTINSLLGSANTASENIADAIKKTQETVEAANKAGQANKADQTNKANKASDAGAGPAAAEPETAAIVVSRLRQLEEFYKKKVDPGSILRPDQNEWNKVAYNLNALRGTDGKVKYKIDGTNEIDTGLVNMFRALCRIIGYKQNVKLTADNIARELEKIFHLINPDCGYQIKTDDLISDNGEIYGDVRVTVMDKGQKQLHVFIICQTKGHALVSFPVNTDVAKLRQRLEEVLAGTSQKASGNVVDESAIQGEVALFGFAIPRSKLTENSSLKKLSDCVSQLQQLLGYQHEGEHRLAHAIDIAEKARESNGELKHDAARDTFETVLKNKKEDATRFTVPHRGYFAPKYFDGFKNLRGLAIEGWVGDDFAPPPSVATLILKRSPDDPGAGCNAGIEGGLNLSNCRALAELAIQAPVEGNVTFPAGETLRSVTIDDFAKVEGDLDLSGCNGVEELTINYVLGGTFPCPGGNALRRLTIGQRVKIVDDLDLRQYDQLKTLRIDGSVVGTVTLPEGAALKSLSIGQEASIGGCPDLANCAGLEELRLNGTITGGVALHGGIKGTLRALSIGVNTDIREEGKKLSEYTNLEELRIDCGTVDKFTLPASATLRAITIGQHADINGGLDLSGYTQLEELCIDCRTGDAITLPKAGTTQLYLNVGPNAQIKSGLDLAKYENIYGVRIAGRVGGDVLLPASCRFLYIDDKADIAGHMDLSKCTGLTSVRTYKGEIAGDVTLPESLTDHLTIDSDTKIGGKLDLSRCTGLDETRLGRMLEGRNVIRPRTWKKEVPVAD